MRPYLYMHNSRACVFLLQEINTVTDFVPRFKLVRIGKEAELSALQHCVCL